ncbi:MAG: UDP-3-O-acyl-N-acetylglucosamine deacetylase [Acidobacteriota bacterium]|nr:UDP-3-O-acyl-N-acetylglucosamine deacetylase [Acidobacteriota bacterium]MDH3784923.1 UDP-3-O-acyl-N-acetylglucosamine deacetylase [Acidobacteriota bacterium]
MRLRQTVAEPATLQGTGLHTGQPVTLCLRPAAAGRGIRFIRSDRGGIEIPARLEYVGPSFYATVLQHEGVTVSTIEHLMAALYALLVDDVDVVLDGPEVPILDGSSKPFVDCILDAGLKSLDMPRQYITLIKPIQLEVDEKRIAAYPCREYRVTYAIDFDHPNLGYQELTTSLWGNSAFADKLAPARTFTFEREVEALQKQGLAQGGSLENAVVIGEQGVLNDSLRFEDEFVRHKMLDLTGDLSLIGHPLRAHVVAYRAGHDLHGRFARRILQARDSWYLAPWDDNNDASEPSDRAVAQ